MILSRAVVVVTLRLAVGTRRVTAHRGVPRAERLRRRRAAFERARPFGVLLDEEHNVDLVALLGRLGSVDLPLLVGSNVATAVHHGTVPFSWCC